MSRYAGPYVIATRLRDLGYDVRVVEWFTRHENPLELIEPLIDRNTVAVCLSTTFLIRDPFFETSPEERLQILNRTGRQSFARFYENSAMWHPTVEQCADWFRGLRGLLDRKAPDAKIVLGGARVNHFYAQRPGRIEQVLPEVDYALIGAADDTIVHLFEDIRAGRRPYGDERGGITFIKPVLVRTTCPAIEYRDVDLIQPGEALPIEIKRGCAFNCKFCHYEKRGATLKDLTVLRDEFQRNYDRFGTTLYTFSDDCFNDSRKNVDAICNTIAKLPFQIEWTSYARADLAIKFPDTLDAMVQSGARGLFFGIETFNYEAGRAAGKGVPPDRVKQFLLDTMAKHGKQMLIQCSFISGLPHETDQSMSEMIDWVMANPAMHMFGCSPLGLYEYDPDLDETIIDYSDYARNPQKYGLEEVRHSPDLYWRHATMDLPRAQYWASEATQRWYSNKQPVFRSMWWYPSYRALGYGHDEIISRLLEPNGWNLNGQARWRWKQHATRYWEQVQAQ